MEVYFDKASNYSKALYYFSQWHENLNALIGEKPEMSTEDIQQLYKLCESCDNDPFFLRDDCEDCTDGKLLIDKPIETLEKITELMERIKESERAEGYTQPVIECEKCDSGDEAYDLIKQLIK